MVEELNSLNRFTLKNIFPMKIDQYWYNSDGHYYIFMNEKHYGSQIKMVQGLVKLPHIPMQCFLKTYLISQTKMNPGNIQFVKFLPLEWHLNFSERTVLQIILLLMNRVIISTSNFMWYKIPLTWTSVSLIFLSLISNDGSKSNINWKTES